MPIQEQTQKHAVPYSDGPMSKLAAELRAKGGLRDKPNAPVPADKRQEEEQQAKAA